MAIFRRGLNNWGKDRHFGPLSCFGIDDWCRRHFDREAKLWHQASAYVYRGSRWRRNVTHQWILFMAASLDVVFISRRVYYRPKTTEQNLIVLIGEIEAAVTIIRDCTRGIVRLSYTYRHEPWRTKHRADSLRQLSFVFSLLEWRLPPGDATEQRSLRYVIIRHYRLQRARCTQSSCVECRRQGANCHQTTESCI